MVAGGGLCLAAFLYNAKAVMEGGIPRTFPLALYLPGLALMGWGALAGGVRR
jgi:hypothetical protein